MNNLKYSGVYVAVKQLIGWTGMSEEGNFWVTIAEKLIGIILIIVSIIMLYLTATSGSTLNLFTGFFGFLGVVVLIAGGLLIVVKPPE